MLRALLRDRFGLAVHHERRNLPVYVLAGRDARPGPQLRRSTQDCDRSGSSCGIRIGFGPVAIFFATGEPVAAVARAFERLLNRTVIDETGLSGNFDIELTFNPDGLPILAQAGLGGVPVGGDAASFFTAVQEQLGLTLKPTKGPVDVVVIERAELPRAD